MTRRNYRNGQATTLAFPVSALDTTIQVNSATSFPTQYPYTLILEPDGSLEEVIDVVNGTGTTLTVVRGVDGTTASTHSAGVQIYHGVSARDADEANLHANSTTNVHGTTGDLVDTTRNQGIGGTKNFTGALQVAGAPVVDTATNQTVGGTKTFTNAPPVTGKGTVATTGGDQTFSGANTFTGTETHSGTEAHSGDEVHSGKLQFTNATMRPSSAVSTVDEDIASITYQSGGTPVGVSYTVPDSGQIWVTFSGYISQTIGGSRAILSFRIGTGSAVGAGTDVLLPSSDRSLVCGTAVNASQPAELQATRRVKVSGLTPGQVQNVVLQGAVNPSGHCLIFLREIHVEPII